MKCPVCKDPNLVMSERSGVEIDYCPECRGVWLDRGELDKILERARASEAPAFQQSMQRAYSQPQQPSYHQKPYKRKKSFLEKIFD